MDFDELFRCLVEAESRNLRAELTCGRFIVVGYPAGENSGTAGVSEAFGTTAEATNELSVVASYAECCSFAVVGVTESFYDALDVLGEELGCDEETLAELDEELDFDAVEDSEDRTAAALTRIRAPKRRAVAHLLIGSAFGPMDVVSENFDEDIYLGHVAAHLIGARFVMLVSATPPNQELAFAILELQPTGAPGMADRTLLLAAAARDVAALSAAIRDGADVNALDEHGATPLHRAVAARDPEAVHMLLTAGANPRAQMAFGNAPQFAAAGGDSPPKPVSRRIEGEEHWAALWLLLDAGAEINAVDTAGRTLLDLAIRSKPYPEREVERLVERGAVSRALRNVTVDSLVTNLPYGAEADLHALKNRVCLLLDIGAPYDHPLNALLAGKGYYEHELSGDYLAELVDIMVSRGVRDRPGTYGRTAREHAQRWVDRGLTHYQAAVDRLAVAAADAC